MKTNHKDMHKPTQFPIVYKFKTQSQQGLYYNEIYSDC